MVKLRRNATNFKSFLKKVTDKKWKKVVILFVCVLALNSLLSVTTGMNIIETGLRKFFSSNVLESQQVKSVEIPSKDWDDTNPTPGSWHITKSAEWIESNTAEIKFDVESVMKLADESKDIIFILDTSESMLAEKYINGRYVTKLVRMKEDATALTRTVLSRSDNRIALVEFNTRATILSEFTNDTESVVNKISSLGGYGATNYRDALEKAGDILSNVNYEHIEGRDLVILFLSDGLPVVESPNQIGEYEALKEKYPKMIAHAVQYEMGNEIAKELVDISDRQYLAYMDNLKNMLFEASTAIKFYEEFDVTDFIKTKNFQVNSEEQIEVSKGTVEFDKTNQKVIWHLGSYNTEEYSGTFMSGSEATMTIQAELVSNLKNTVGLFDTNEKETINYHLYNEISKTVNSSLTPKLYNGYTVYYEANPPTGCTLANSSKEEVHSVFDIVKIDDDSLVCDGYLFKGWKIIESDETYLSTQEYESGKKYKINDTSFRMPAQDIHIQGTWTKLNISKSMSGTIYEVKKVPLIDKLLETGKDPNTGTIPIDNVRSTYVNSDTGINFARASGETNGKGLYIRAGSENDENPIYYYRGAITNNNVLFAGFCWKIVRTTETGGIKLVYNGEPTNNQCVTSAIESQGINENTYPFNSNLNSPTYSGYMYGKTYPYTNKQMSGTATVLTSMYTDRQYYFTNEVPTWNGSQYVLSDTNDGVNSFVGVSADVASKLTGSNGFYTCLTATAGDACSTVYYVAVASGDSTYYYSIAGGKTIEDSENIVLGTGVTDNGDGTYTLTGTTTVKRIDWYPIHVYESYWKYYTCSNLVDKTCDAFSMYYITSTSSTSIYWTVAKEIAFGNDVTYENGKYTLKEITTKATNTVWSESIANTKHYTCLSKETSCETVYYIYYQYSNSGDGIQYIALNGVENIDAALEDMFSNKTNSNIKTEIDNWYKTNIENKNYSSHLENAVWCNDRSIGTYNGWNKDTNNYNKGNLYYGGYRNDKNLKLSSGVNPGLKDNLACPNIRDRFTVDEDGDKGNGNGDLTYKIGMLTADEMTAAGNGWNGYSFDTYLFDNVLFNSFWTLSPDYLSVWNATRPYSYEFLGYVNGNLNSNGVSNSAGARVAISLNSDTQVLETGDGTSSNPYRLEP